MLSARTGPIDPTQGFRSVGPLIVGRACAQQFRQSPHVLFHKMDLGHLGVSSSMVIRMVFLRLELGDKPPKQHSWLVVWNLMAQPIKWDKVVVWNIFPMYWEQ